jgi:hypothetical protein
MKSLGVWSGQVAQRRPLGSSKSTTRVREDYTIEAQQLPTRENNPKSIQAKSISATSISAQKNTK